MSRRLALLAAGICVAWAAVWIGAGCASATKKEAQSYDTMDPATRLLTIETEGPAAGEAAVAAVKALLDDESIIYRAEAAQILGTWAAGGEDPAMVLPALMHKDPLVRGMAQAAYLENDARNMAPLVVMGTLVEVPLPILQSLAELGDPYGLVDIEGIIHTYQEPLRKELGSSPQVAVLAADILGRIGDVAARTAIIRTVRTADGMVRAKAVRACVRDDLLLGPALLPLGFNGDVLSRRAVMAALVAKPDPHQKALPERGLADVDETVRHNAIRALANLGAAAPVDVLAAKLQGEPSFEKLDIIIALGAIGKSASDALRAYARETKDPDEFQVQALLALAPNADRNDVGWVSERLTSPNARLRAAAASVLGQIRHPLAQDSLMAQVKDPDPLVRATVAKALGQIGTIYASKQLLLMLDDPAPIVCTMAAWGLGEAEYPEAVPVLEKLVRTHAASDTTPAQIGEMYGRPELAAVQAIGRLGAAKSIPFLRDAMESKSWRMRAAATEALGAVGDKSTYVIEILEKRLTDPVNLVRAKALVALKHLGKTYPPGMYQSW